MKINKVLFLLLFSVCLGLNVYLRLFPAHFPQLKKEAELRVEDTIINDTSERMDEKFLKLPLSVRNKILQEVLQKEKKNRKEFKKKVQEEYKKLKDPYQNESYQTYLLALDPYCWTRLARLVLENGYPGNKKIGKDIYDTYMLAPQGAKLSSFRFLEYASSSLYKVASFILPKLSLERFLFYLPLFFSCLFFICLYLFCWRFFSKVTGILALLFTGLSSIFIYRSCVGWYDNDVLNLLLPLLVIWSIAAALDNKSFVKTALLSLLGAFFLSIYAFTWIGWWFIFVVIIAFFVYTLINNLSLDKGNKIIDKKDFSRFSVSVSVFFLASFFLCLFIAKVEPFSYTINSLITNLGLGKSLDNSIWPNTYYTVQELRPGNFAEISQRLGGRVPLTLAIMAVLWVYVKEKRSKKSTPIILLVFWLFVMSFASLKGLRFALFLSVPTGIFLGAGLDEFSTLLVNRARDLKNTVLKYTGYLAVVLIFYLAIFPFVNLAFERAKTIFPMIDDKWYTHLNELRNSTSDEAILNSWWDYGDWFKEVGKRRVIFDGQSQKGPLAHWMARVLLTDNEEEAIHILRMINNSSDTLFGKIADVLKDDFASIALLNRLLKSSPENADEILENYALPENLRDEIKQTIFLKEPAEAYFIVDKTMLYKISAISFLGNWDFAKVYIMKNKKMPKKHIFENLENLFSLSLSQAENLYQQVLLSSAKAERNEILSSRWIFKYGIGKGTEEDGLIYFDNGVVLDSANTKARIFIKNQRAYKKFKHVFIFDGERLAYKNYQDTDFDFGCLFFKDKDQYRCVGLNQALGRSLFCKLYFMRAKGLKYFEPFLVDEEAGIYTYKINWSSDE